ncbi:Methyl-accepting chemotaxis protein I [Anatilimnocola aggregata]|uniref:Methyl-accepting chemotaxis protein I n=1 Tax=Anatilimnocola aggregata TaxID=2528021 RepID=A0A517YK18_9BACT|nr:methyl-accepting chemotaxis protein [Anatilimnocola aggregata]QDU30569.1 Methyl-accepting chemotaxis protein I [Anatilimnocola aggregata]
MSKAKPAAVTATKSKANAEVAKLRSDLAINRAMAENSPINILFANKDLVITYANPASIRTLKTLEKYLPIRAEELIGKSVDIFHKVPSHQRRILSSDRNLPHRAIIAIGDQKADLLVSPTYDDKGEYLGPMVTWEVVTEKLMLEDKSRDSNEQLAAVGKVTAKVEFNMDGTIVTANENFLGAVGYSLNEIVGKHHRIFCSKEYANSTAYSQFWDKLNRGEFEVGEFMRVNKRGEEIWISATYYPINDVNGKPCKVVKFATDITAARKAAIAANEKSAIVENAPINIMLANNQGIITYINPASMKALKKIEHLLPIKADQIVGSTYDIFHKMPAHQRRLLADPKNLPHLTQIKLGGEILSLQANAIFDAKGNYSGPMVTWEIITERIAAEEREKENQLRERRTQQELSEKVTEVLAVVNAAAAGDLTREISFSGDDSMGQLASGVRKMMTDLRNIISQVVEGAAQFAEGARVIAETAQSQAQGAQTQSASVEEMSASIEQLTRSIETVKNNAASANTLACETSRMAEEGGQAVQKSVEAMGRIKSSSEQISEIIQVIGEIASQTNLLALNAAIEAARAGVHGLGFAVVADEVRKLAERSSEAAKEISKLIKESTQRVADGATLSEQTGQALSKIIQGVDSTAKKINEIATATVEQAQNATEVAGAVQQISTVTEQAAASCEEMASSSEELGAQASTLRELVRKFKTE